MSSSVPLREGGSLRRFVGPHFNLPRFFCAILTGLVATTLVWFSGISEPLDQWFLDLRMWLRPNLIQPQVPVRIALLGHPALLTDVSFQQETLRLLERLQTPGLPTEERPGSLVLAHPLAQAPLSKEDSTRFLKGLQGVLEADVVGSVTLAYSLAEREIASDDVSVLDRFSFPLPLQGADGLRVADGVLVPNAPEKMEGFALAIAVGYTNVSAMREHGVIRSMPLIMRLGNRVYPSLGLAAAMAAQGVGPDRVSITPGESVVLRPLVGPPIAIPIDLHGEVHLNYRPTLGTTQMGRTMAQFNFAQPPSEVMVNVSAAEALTHLRPNGRILFVGDPRVTVRTPLHEDVPLVNIHAQLATDIITGDFLERVHPAIDLTFAMLVVGLFALVVGRWDPQGLGPVGAAVMIGSSHGLLAVLLFGAFSYWMNMALVLEVMLLTVPIDGVFLNYQNTRMVRRLRLEIDGWEQEESVYLENITQEEQEQTDRLELLRHQEALARSILDRQEALVAKVIPSKSPKVEPTVEDDEPIEESEREPAHDGFELGRETSSPGGGKAGQGPLLHSSRLSTLEDASSSVSAPAGSSRGVSQSAVLRELAARYRTQAARQETLLARYRQLLDQVLVQLEESWARQPAVLPSAISSHVADELVALTGVITQDSTVLQQLHQVVTRIGPNDRATVLIQGESGTGKELIAQAIHRHSKRGSGPYIAINCSAVPEGLIESELFGHVKGAFSGAGRSRRGAFLSAEGGVLFLDEIGDAPANIQVKLLRAIQERAIRPVGADAPIPVDVRIVAATHRDLRAEVSSGRFREDLYHRLHVIPISLPPLRERSGDVPLLCDVFLREEAKAGHHPPRTFSEGALARLLRHRWPGNVRELENCIVALNAVATEQVIDESMVAQALGQSMEKVRPETASGFSAVELKWLEVFRRHQFAIVKAVGDRDAPARNRQTGYRRLVGLSCKSLCLSEWKPLEAAALLAGEAHGPAMDKALGKIRTYVRSLEQALESKDMAKFEADWRRFLGDEYFYVKATLEAVSAGKVSSDSVRATTA